MAVALRALALLALSLPAAAHAEEREIAPTMPHYGYDIGYVAVGGALYLTSRFAFAPREGNRAPLDGRGTRGFLRPADVASDVLYYVGIFGAPLTGYLLDGSRSDFVRALRVPVVVFESYIMASALNTTTKLSGICRPYSWDEPTRTCGVGSGVPSGPEDQRTSFPSGHAVGPSSISGALMGMWLLPQARDHRFAPLALGATALSLTTGALRVRAGAHSVVDVGVGFALGFGVGFGTAALHLRARPLPVTVSPTAHGFALHGTF